MATCRARADCGSRFRPGSAGRPALRPERRMTPVAEAAGAVAGRAATGREEPDLLRRGAAGEPPRAPAAPARVERDRRELDPGRRCWCSLISGSGPRGVAREGQLTEITGSVAEVLLDPQQLVVLGYTLGPGRRA